MEKSWDSFFVKHFKFLPKKMTFSVSSTENVFPNHWILTKVIKN